MQNNKKKVKFEEDEIHTGYVQHKSDTTLEGSTQHSSGVKPTVYKAYPHHYGSTIDQRYIDTEMAIQNPKQLRNQRDEEICESIKKLRGAPINNLENKSCKNLDTLIENLRKLPLDRTKILELLDTFKSLYNLTNQQNIQTNKKIIQLKSEICFQIIKNIVSEFINTNNEEHKEFIVMALFYNASNGYKKEFIDYFGEHLGSKNNQIIGEGFEAIQKLCGAKFDMTKIKPISFIKDMEDDFCRSSEKFLEISAAQNQYEYTIQQLKSLKFYVQTRMVELSSSIASAVYETLLPTLEIYNSNDPKISETFKANVVEHIKSLLYPGLQHRANHFVSNDSQSNLGQRPKQWTSFTNNDTPGTPQSQPLKYNAFIKLHPK